MAEAGDKAIIEEAKARFKRCQEYEADARAHHVEDVMFANGDSRNGWQWDSAVMSARQGDGLPCLTSNKTKQHNLMIVNDARENKSSPKVSPIGDGATSDAAQVFNGIIRHIENQSNAQDAYIKAIDDQVDGGLGWVRVITDYAADQDGVGAFNQEIFYKRVADPLSIYVDPDAQEADKSDSRFGFVYNDIARDLAEARYPWLKKSGNRAPLDHGDGWDTKNHVREAEYFRVMEEDDTRYLMPDGTTALKSKLPDNVINGTDSQPGITDDLNVQSRRVIRRWVEWYRIVGDRIVDRQRETVWQWVPLVPFLGIETVVSGKMDRRGHTRALLDDQRMYNFWASTEAEGAGYQTKIPYIGPAEAFEGHETEWRDANRSSKAFLPYNHMGDDGSPIPTPQRIQPPVSSDAAQRGMQTALNGMMLVSGQYEAEFGQKSNERSGTAILQRQRQADRATYHFVDRAAQAMRFLARITVAAIPKVYDSARVLRIVQEDGTEDHVIVDPMADQSHQQMPTQVPQHLSHLQRTATGISAIFNPNIGRYAVVAEVGPSFATKRQQAAQAYMQMVQGFPDLVKIAGDIVMKATDLPYSDEIADRLRRAIPPNLLNDGPDPALQGMQHQLQQAAQMHTMLLQQLAEKERQLKDKSQELTIRDYEAETRRFAANAQADPEAMKLVVREQLSQLLGMPAVLPMMAHAQVNGAMQQLSTPQQPDAGAQEEVMQ